MPARTIRKIQKIGCSRGTVLPPDWLRAFNLDAGDEIEIIYDNVVVVKPRGLSISPEDLMRDFKALQGANERRE